MRERRRNHEDNRDEPTSEFTEPGAGSGGNKSAMHDPTLVCTAFNHQRFYLFTRREPEDDDNATANADGGVGRDVFNEKPPAEEVRPTVFTSLSLSLYIYIHVHIAYKTRTKAI